MTSKTPTQRVREYRLRHPESAREYYAASRRKRKERAQAELDRKRAVMAEIMERAKK